MRTIRKATVPPGKKNGKYSGKKENKSIKPFIENEYFKEYGINLELILTSGADKVTAALLSGDAQIGLSGSEATIYVYNAGEKDYLKTFSQLTQKDGTFLVGRKKQDNFKITDVIGKSIIGGRAAGMPEMTLEYILKQNGIDPRKDVNIIRL